MNTPAPVPPAPTPPPASSSDDRTLAIIAPITAIFTGFVGPLIIYLVKKGDGDSLALRSARESLNFQITLALLIAACVVTVWLIIPIFIIWAAGIANLVLSIVHAIRASDSKDYVYPWTLRLVKD